MKVLLTTGRRALDDQPLGRLTHKTSLNNLRLFFDDLHGGQLLNGGKVILASLMNPETLMVLHKLQSFFMKIVGLEVAVIVKELLTFL
jgi:hypothetical protein